MRPGDCVVLAGVPYVLLALYGRLAAGVPVVSGYHSRQRGDVALDPLQCGVPLRYPVARVRGLRKIDLRGAEQCGCVPETACATILQAARREAKALAMEAKYSACGAWGRAAAAEVSACR